MKSDLQPIPPEDKAGSESHPTVEIKRIFESAAELQGSEREDFLAKECGHSAHLRQQLDALLRDYDDSGEFFPAAIDAIQSLLETEQPTPATNDPQIGNRIGAYRIEREIGRGGMGAVYLATRADSEFDKRVAIKLIRDDSLSDFAIRQFRYERQILARLENAYIARLIDGGTTEKGSPYFVMEYVEGISIRDYCQTSSLATRDRLALFLKVCSAVQYAHERNIIHRDLKPGNILVKRDGTPKLLDFGIAKILYAENAGAESDATIQGFRILTPAYASPEQMRGDTVTTASDIYSLGIILYELLCGSRPNLGVFQQDTNASEVTRAAPLSASLRAILFTAIQLDPLQRYASVEAFAADISRYLTGLPLAANESVKIAAEVTESGISLAVLPFRMRGEQSTDKAFLANGITEALITRLSRLERLSVPPPSSILKYTGGVEAGQAARDLHVKYVLEGSIHIFGNCVRANVQLVFAEAGVAIWAAQIDAEEEDLLKLEDSIAQQVADAVVPHLGDEERAELSRSGTSSGQAHAAYLRGRWHWSRSAGDQEQLARALAFFMQAIAIDPKYAKAYAGVADYYLHLGLWGGLPPAESFGAALEYARNAVQLEPTLGEAHASLAFALWAYERDEKSAERHFNLATTRDPHHASAHHWFGLFNSARNRPDIAIANLERARRLDPHSAVIAAAMGFVYCNARQFDVAVQVLTEVAREIPKSRLIQERLAWCHLGLGDTGKALEAARTAVELGDRGSAAIGALAQAEAAAGNSGRAAALRDEIEALAAKRYVPGYDRATAFMATGQGDEALRCLERARGDKDWWSCWIGVDPRWDSLRREARFQKLLPSRKSAVKQPGLRALAVPAACLLGVLIGLGWWVTKRAPAPFTNLKFTKLTTNGTADSAVISPDGKTVVYTAMVDGGIDIWRRDVASARVFKLVARLTGTVTNLAFTDNGATIAFVVYPPKQPQERELFTVPVSGGTPQRLMGTFSGPVGLSVDGGQAAFFESNATAGMSELWVADTKTGERQLLTSYQFPEHLETICKPAWSPDGKLLAYAAEQNDRDGYLVRLYVIDTKTRSRHVVASPRWQWIQSVAWMGDKSALAAVGQERDSSFQQVWYLPYPNPKGSPRRIGNDLDDYIGASLTARSSELVSVQQQTLANIYVLKAGDPSHPVQVTLGSGRYFDLSWMPDGQILYASDATGSADLWLMNGDGSGERQITAGSGRNYAPVSSPDAKSIAFHSNRSGNWQVWRADADGSHPLLLSRGVGDGNWPQFAADGKSVLFHRTGIKGAFNLWRVPATGGALEQITNALTMHPAVSRKDGKIAAWYSETTENPHWKLAIFSPAGGQPLQTFNPTPNAKPDTPIRWTTRGDAIAFLDYAHGCSNIWLQPVDGRPPHAITSFTSGDIYSFDWSAGEQIAYSRGLTTADVILIRDVNASRK